MDIQHLFLIEKTIFLYVCVLEVSPATRTYIE